ncbi:unnamed protein product [Durusdinium trenchii]|uniref:DUF4116 domain-containing protein n=1 Tax=Durusdinium trenchii TaxID=1381693 RepID=A0ABP0L6I6_9DINO
MARVTVVTAGGTIVAENHKLEPDDTFSELLEMGILKIPHDPDTILRFQLLSPSGEILKKETRVASRVNDGDTLTFIMVARDPRAHAWIPRVNSDPDCLKCAPEYARSDRFVVMEAVAKDGQALGYAVPELRADKEVVSRAVSQDGRSLQFASPELRDDKEVALKAVLNQGRALEFASERLRGDFEMVLCACTNEGNSLEFATKEWQKHQKIVLLAVDRPYQQAKILGKIEDGGHWDSSHCCFGSVSDQNLPEEWKSEYAADPVCCRRTAVKL